jgi:predicted O-linked N-acetylglucosamine transferase (SPINDLY family)
MHDLLQAFRAAQRLHQSISGYETHKWRTAQAGGALLVEANPHAILQEIGATRREIARLLHRVKPTETATLAEIEALHTASGRLRGIMFQHPLTPAERRTRDQHWKTFARDWAEPACFRAFTVLSYYYQPFELPLQKNIAGLAPPLLARYLYFIMRQPHIMQAADEAAYVRYYQDLTEWLLQLLHAKKSPLDAAQRDKVQSIMGSTLTFGTCYYLDHSIATLVRARAKLLQRMLQLSPEHQAVVALPRPTLHHRKPGKIRLGIISRNIGDYTDTRALFGMFSAFDPKRYELYWYSLDVLDPTTGHNVAFYRQLFRRIHKLTGLRHSAARNAQTILADQLDMLVVGSAYSFGLKDYDQLLAHRLAPIQIGFNPMVPSAACLPSYDYYLTTPPADAMAAKNYAAEATEPLRFMPDPLVWYDKRPASVPNGFVTRQALGIAKDAVVYFSGAVANKHMPGTMQCWLEILRHNPKAVLILMPFNPAWGGYFIGLTFLNRLQHMLKAYPDIAHNRIRIIREVTPEEGNQILLLADIYLGSFPHGGATSAMLALRHGVPVVARRSPWLRGTSDPSLLASLGLQELIGADNQGFIDIAVRLGTEPTWREQLQQHIKRRIDRAPFFNPTRCSKHLQTLFDQLLAEHQKRV